MCIKTGDELRPRIVGRKGEKSRRYRPWVVAPISMAATPAAFAGGGGRAAAASSTGAGLEAVGFRVRRLPVGFCLRCLVFLLSRVVPDKTTS